MATEQELLDEVLRWARESVAHWNESNGTRQHLRQALVRYDAQFVQPEAVPRPDVMSVRDLGKVQLEVEALGKVQHGLSILSNQHSRRSRTAYLVIEGDPPRDAERPEDTVHVAMEKDWAEDILVVRARNHRARLAAMGVKP